MPFKSIPITGHLKDSAGNVVTGTKIEVKLVTPSGNVSVDSFTINNSGYFETSPLPSGRYNFYSSGVFVTSIRHRFNNSVPCHKPLNDNINQSIIRDFSTCADLYEASEYRVMLQIDGDYPTHKTINANAMHGIQLSSGSPLFLKNDLEHAEVFLSMNNESSFTTTRFNVEYSVERPYGESRSRICNVIWTGVPGVKYSSGSSIVLPLDYYSMLTRLPYSSHYSTVVDDTKIGWQSTGSFHYMRLENGCFGGVGAQGLSDEMFSSTPLGSVVKIISIANPAVADSPRVWQRAWFGIVSRRVGSAVEVEPLRSSRYMDADIIAAPQENLVLDSDSSAYNPDDPLPANGGADVQNGDVLYVQFFDGMQRSMASLSDEVNMQFMVSECPISDIMLQNGREMYTYEHSQSVLAAQ